MKPPVRVTVQAQEDRRQPGTKRDRRRHLPAEVRVRVWMIMAALLTVAAGVGVAIRNTSSLDSLAHRVATDEYSTCVIQARGLPASHLLAASMADIHRLLTLPPLSPAQKLAAKNTPPQVKLIIADLNMQLAGYQAIEAKQPKTRSCGLVKPRKRKRR